LVELASDINANIILQKQGKTPDSYKDSFQRLEKIGILQGGVCKKLIDSVKLRNGLVHEYEFDLDNRKLYDSIKKDFIPAYGEYLKSVLNRTK
ncbi:MAG: HepT-like ribonuclease domain-containing protein, partial [Patescibacteria group bacterium]